MAEKKTAKQDLETVGGPEKNADVRDDALTAEKALQGVQEAVKGALEEAKSSLSGLSASDAVVSARSTLAGIENALLRGASDIERLKKQLPTLP